MTKVERKASVLACDDMLFGLTGKVFLQGVYVSDITIPGDELTINQLIFYFTVETPKDRPFKAMSLKVIPPGQPPTQLQLSLEAAPQFINAARPKMILRAPLVVQNFSIKPGKIETIAITESEELDAGGVWCSSIARFSSTN